MLSLSHFQHVLLELTEPEVECVDLLAAAAAREVAGVHKHVAVRDGHLQMRRQRVGIAHADEPQLPGAGAGPNVRETLYHQSALMLL